jgi:two-component system sensor histidine kinase/response regulator
MNPLPPQNHKREQGWGAPGHQLEDDREMLQVLEDTAATVLIVEDEVDILMLLDYRLRRENYRTLTATDGISACRLIEKEVPDLVLLDIMLPDLNGWEVCRFIRHYDNEAVASTPIIMVTALTNQANKIHGLEIGANVYLPKPYSINEVLLHCKRLLGEKIWQQRLREEVNRLRDREGYHADFQGMLCHELRAQLTMIQGLCRRLQNRLSSIERARNGQYLDMIQKSTSHLTSLAEEILLLSKVETTNPALELDALDLGAVIQEVLALYTQPAAAKGVTLYTGGNFPQDISMNRAALTIILSNLIENGIKYCLPGTAVLLYGRIMNNTAVILEVSNQGGGIPPTEQQKIFERYYRGQGVRATTKGSGLGLYAVRKLTQNLGGEVRVQSVAGVGTRFQVRFPLNNGEI